MSTSFRVTNIDPHSTCPLRVQVWQVGAHSPEPASPISEHQLRFGETLALTARADQRVVVIEKAPSSYSGALAAFRNDAPPPDLSRAAITEQFIDQELSDD